MKLCKVQSDIPYITGEDYKDPVKFELEIQRQRIMGILKTTIRKMEIMAVLPTLIHGECRALKKFFKQSEVDFIILTTNKYLTGNKYEDYQPEAGSSVNRISEVLDKIILHAPKTEREKEQEEGIQVDLLASLIHNEKVDYHIAQVIQMLVTCQPLVRCLDKYPIEIEENVYDIIKCMRQLKGIINEKLLITSKEQMNMDRKLRTAYKSNYMISASIGRLQNQMNKQRIELEAELEVKQARLDNLLTKIEGLKEEFDDEVLKRVYESEKQMTEDSVSSEMKQVELQTDASNITSQYNGLVETDLVEEGYLRAKRNKVESQLASWLAKYDNDMGEKQAELEGIEEHYLELKTEYGDLMVLFDEQTVEYDILMEEKHAEEYARFEEKAIAFLRNRAARIIQREWRAYLARKLARKKAKKGKGKEKGGKGKKGKAKGKGKNAKADQS